MLDLRTITQTWAYAQVIFMVVGIFVGIAALFGVVVLLFKFMLLCFTVILQMSHELMRLYDLQYSIIQLALLVGFLALIVWIVKRVMPFFTVKGVRI